MLNGRRVNIRHVGLAPNAINDEASKKLVSIVYYENHNYSKFLDKGVSIGEAEDWYCLLRNLQGVKILEQIYRGKVRHMTDDKGFIKDGLFCEYAYILNLDTMNLELYVHGEKIGEFPLTDIPENWMKIYED